MFMRLKVKLVCNYFHKLSCLFAKSINYTKNRRIETKNRKINKMILKYLNQVL